MSDGTYDALRPVVPDGTHLGYSKGPSGTYRALLFEDGTNRMLGPAELTEVSDDGLNYRPVDLDDPDDVPPLGVLIAAAVLVVAIEVAPHVQTWWQEKASPTLAALRARWVRRADKATPTGGQRADISVEVLASAELTTLSRTAASDFAAAVETVTEPAPGDTRTTMTSAEAQRRIAALLAAAAFIADQIRSLSGARIVDDADFAELASAMRRLSMEQVTEGLNRMLEADATVLDEPLSAELMRVFGGGRVVEGDYVPIRHERVQQALRLSRS